MFVEVIKGYRYYHNKKPVYPITEFAYWESLHRDDGPAIENIHNDEQEWYYNGKLHRDNGPAVYFDNSVSKNIEYYIHGKLHCTTGPASYSYSKEDNSEFKLYCLLDKQYTYKEWETLKDFPMLW